MMGNVLHSKVQFHITHQTPEHHVSSILFQSDPGKGPGWSSSVDHISLSKKERQEPKSQCRLRYHVPGLSRDICTGLITFSLVVTDEILSINKTCLTWVTASESSVCDKSAHCLGDYDVAGYHGRQEKKNGADHITSVNLRREERWRRCQRTSHLPHLLRCLPPLHTRKHQHLTYGSQEAFLIQTKVAHFDKITGISPEPSILMAENHVCPSYNNTSVWNVEEKNRHV